MSLVCPKCASSGEFIRQNDDHEVRKCRVCGYEYEIRIDIDDDPYPDDDYPDYPEGGPTCPYCHSTKTQIGGVASDGDGDLYDDCYCSSCGENFPVNLVWIDDAGNRFDDQDEYYALGTFDEREDEAEE
jgi:transcription elongation factor Elf1